MKKRMISLLMALAMSLTLLPATSYAAEESGTAIGAGRLCEHHTAHDDACGYVEGIEESPCTHEHGAECYTEVTSCIHEHTQDCYPVSDSGAADNGGQDSDAGNDEAAMPSDTQADGDAMPSGTQADEGAAASGNEPGESAASSEAAEPTECSHVCSVESGCIKQELDCHHEHNEECGYAPAVEGQPCTYVCTLCGMTEITAWSWVDTQDVLDPESGVLALSASAESPVPYEDIVALLPVEIEATTEDGTETLSLDSWSCDDYPAEGAYTGSYAFHAVLPEGYGLAADAPALTVTVELEDEVMLMAAGATHAEKHPICGASCTHDTKHYNDYYNNWLASDYGTDSTSLVLRVGGPNSTYGDPLETSGNEWVLPAGTYYLKDDIHIDKTIRIDENVTICLNGHDIYIDKDVAAFRITKKNQASKSCKLKLTNCKERCGEIKSNNTDNRGNGVNIIDGTFDMYGGKIRGCRRGVFVDSSCTFNMYGGEISENEANGVTLINSSNAIFNMYGGEISRNTDYGVEIMVGVTFNMSGGVIKDNPSRISHIGVWCQGGTFKMSGGEISSCTRGVHVTCTDNSLSSGAGRFEMSGGTIKGNKIGVSLFTRYDGKGYSTNNITKSSKFTMTGGEIKNNTDIGVDMGYNKHQNFRAGGELTVGGTAKIQDNSNKNAYSYGNVYFRYGEIKLTSSPAFTKGAYIGITTPDKTLPTAGNPLLIVGNVSSQDEVADYFHSDRDGYVIKCADTDSSHTTHTLNLTVSPHTHNWVYTNVDKSTISVACNGTGTCAYQTTPATVSISTDKPKYDVETITEAPKAVLTYSDNWPDGLAKADESAIKYWKSIDGGSSYTVQITNKEDLRTPGKYLAQLKFNDKWLEALFSVVDNSKKDPTYTTPTAKTGLTYNGQAQALINPGSTNDGEMQYKLDSGAYSTTIPMATNAGTYTVYYKVVGDATHNDTAEQSITVTIGKAPLTGAPTFTPVTEAGKTIADVTLTAPIGWPAGDFFWMKGEIGLNGATPITQGTPYHWVFIPADSDNYQSIGGSIVLWAKGSDAPGQGGGTSGGDNSNTGDSNSSNTVAGNGTSSGNTTGATPAVIVTVPVSGSEKSIQVNARISGTTAIIENVDLSKLETVIGDDVKTGVVTISFSGLNKKVDTVKLPANVVKQIAEAVNDPDNDAESLEIVLSDGSSIEFDAKTLGDKIAQVDGVDITISIRYIDAGTMNNLQQQAVGSRPALDIIVTSGGRPISDMGGRITMYAPYELGLGEQAGGVVVYYVDGNGSKQLCETSYDPIKKQVSWVTTHLSIYMIGYDESRVNPAGNPQENQIAGDSNASCVAYIVQKGNTLWAIAKKYGCTISELVAANSDLIKNPNRIYAGWQLKIPQD